MDGTTPDNVEWVRRKSNVVARFHRSSYAVGLREKQKGQTIYESGDFPSLTTQPTAGRFR